MREPYSAGQLLVEFPLAAAATGDAAGSGDELAELVRQVMTAENFHDPLVRLAWRFIKGGMQSGQVIETLQGLLLALPKPHDERWQARFDEIERTVVSAEAKHRQFRPALDIILDWMQRRYQPGHRNPDQSFYSIALGVDVPLSKIYADREVLDALRFAIETPRAKGRVKDSQLPVVFTRHKPGAYGELLKLLPSRDEAASGDEEFLRQVGALLAAIVPCDRQSIWTRRALGTWCHWFASQQPDEWCRAGSYFAWGRILSDGFQIAIAQALAGQISPTTHRAIHEMSSVIFGRRCQSCGISIGTDDNRLRADGRRLRVVVLSPEFIDSLFLSTDHSDPQSEALHRNFQGKEPNSGPSGNRGRNGGPNAN
jgi:hypothetical protein